MKKTRARSGKKEPAPRRLGPRRVDSLLPDVGGVAFRRYGFTQATLVRRWLEVAGPIFGHRSLPQSIRVPRGKGAGEGATLTVLVEGPFALQMQHVAPELIERANRILGAGTIARLRLVQGGVPAADADRRRVPQAPVAPEAARLPTAFRSIRSAGLKDALGELAARLAGE